METPHVLRLGAERIGRDAFLTELAAALKRPTLKGPWRLDLPVRSS
jgi:hypothetical protein